MIRSDDSVPSIFPTAINGTAWEYINGHWQLVDSLETGKGYWIKAPSAISQVITGSSLSSLTISLNAGWNLIGSVDHDIPAPSIGGIITGNTYNYNGSYSIASTIKPGKGYWIKSSGGTLNLGPASMPKFAPENFDVYSNITITDKNGSNQVLYLKENNEKGLALDRYEMPPAISSDNFDARFSSNRILEAYPADGQSAATYPITIRSAEYPLTISWEIKNSNGKTFTLGIEQNGKNISQPAISGKGEVNIQSRLTSLFITVGGQSELPKEFSLSQNYPNPFNPTTTIRYALPKAAHVTLRVFDILGREVATLVNADQEAGFKSISFDAGAFASGVYLYKVEAGTFIDVKKMVVLK